MRALRMRNFGRREGWAAWRKVAALSIAALVAIAALDLLLPPPLDRAGNLSPLVTDRNGEWLHAFATKEGRWRFEANLDGIDPAFVERLIAVEDQRFYAHWGVDPLAVARAGVSAAKSGRIVSGASTITMQTARLLEPRERTLPSKIAEMVRAHADEKLCALEKFKDAGDRIVDMMLENIEESVDSNTEPFWSALMLEMTAEATRNSEIASTLRTVDADMKARVINYLGAGVNQENIGARLEVLVALLQGIGIRNILNPDLDKAEVLRLVRGIVETLFREPVPSPQP